MSTITSQLNMVCFSIQRLRRQYNINEQGRSKGSFAEITKDKGEKDKLRNRKDKYEDNLTHSDGMISPWWILKQPKKEKGWQGRAG